MPFWVLSDPIHGSITSHRRVELHVAAPWDPGILKGISETQSKHCTGTCSKAQTCVLVRGSPEETDCFTAKGKPVSNTPMVCVLAVSVPVYVISRFCLQDNAQAWTLKQPLAPGLPYFSTCRKRPHIERCKIWHSNASMHITASQAIKIRLTKITNVNARKKAPKQALSVCA